MDMSLREWLILIGVVILVGILLDGYRRMLRAKRDSLEISRSMGGNFESTPLDENFNPELPNGGARVIRRDGFDDDDLPESQGWQDDEEYARQEVPFHAGRHEPDFDADDVSESLRAEQDHLSATPAPQNKPRFPEAVKVLDEPVKPEPQEREKEREGKGQFFEKSMARFGKQLHTKPTQPVQKPLNRKEQKAEAKQNQKKTAANGKQPQEIIIINVLSKDEGGFSGSKLRRLVEACGMEFGEMSVFTRHEHGYGEGPVQFGMANMVEPGTFDIDSMDDSSTPGVCFFLSLPGPEDNMKAFEYMLETAQCVVRNLNGDMKDERRSVFTQQTIEHCRQRVREFERRQQLAARV